MTRVMLLASVATFATAHITHGPEIDLGAGGWAKTNFTPPYDARSCWLMKARYNCQDDTRPEQAPAYRWVARSADGLSSSPGEPDGQLMTLGRALHLVTPRDSGAGPEPPRAHILLVGNSYLRQVFEALACRWRDSMTGAVRGVGPARVAMSMSGLKTLNGKDLDPSNRVIARLNASELVDPPACHGAPGADGAFGGYYRGRAPPQALADCADDVATIEFAGRLRVSYVFRPYAYGDGLSQLFQGRAVPGGSSLGLPYASIDAIVDLQGNAPTLLANIQHARAAAGRPAPFFLEFAMVREQVKNKLLLEMRKRWPKATVGATNGRLVNDGHPCLPGLPDDEADLMLRAIGQRAKFVRGRPPLSDDAILALATEASRAGTARRRNESV